MKFKTRLQVTFFSIIFLPLVLTMMAFIIIVICLTNVRSGIAIQEMDYTMVADNIREFVEVTDETYFTLLDQLKADPAMLEDREYLARVNDEVAGKSTYLIVRKDRELYYTGDESAARRIFAKLPTYGEERLADETGYYFKDLEKYVKQIDFLFSDGSEGSIFIVTKISPLISRHLMIDMFIAIVLILIFTSVMLTQWIRRSVFIPMDRLNTAMQKIKEGQFDYALQTDAGGEIEELYRNYEDMRLQLKESAEEKQENETRNKELISNISHDLKTPITAIKGYVEGIMDGVADTPEKVDKYIKTIYNKANDMDKLINELTTYSGIDNNRIPYNFHRINVADYFGDCVEEVGLELESRNIRLNYSNTVETDTIVIADPEQMKKVINNIIGNSVKYMDKPHGTIDIRILDEVDSIRVEIEDNGKGIAQKDLQKIFERFYRTDASRNSAQGGSGIGLSIVKKIIEDHGGYIWATGKEGEGTCMHFVLRKYIELQPGA
ncbi:MAG: HAMP domain-containing histidine kinase [Clostridium sp.]|nr:HAMP domain-containing histidine kinase [Acetatifactor muris]MCM1528327.1 HAMP domain-containing histidine kinase [Bacteroides sp.]MCM1563902.1 HAMP domain-containing histidine kinase [Clostridium sp.]